MLRGPIKLKVLRGTVLGDNEILASKHDIAALKVKQGHFETAILVLHSFVVFYCGLIKVFRSITSCVLQGPIRLKVLRGTMLGNNEILASKHDIAALKVKQGHFETAILVLHNFVVFYNGLIKVFRSITFKYLHDSNGEYSDAARFIILEWLLV